MAGKALDADVCIVGAGFAGLNAARRLSDQGRTVVVLEARDRVGGRTWTEEHDGLPIDRGGAWLNPHHDAAFALARELGVGTYKTYVAGSHLLVGGGRIRRYKGLIPKISPLAVLTIAAAQFRLDRMAKKVPLDAPWESPRAEEWDAQSFGAWLDKTTISSTVGKDLFNMAARGLFSAPDAGDVSLLHMLYLVRAHRTIEELFSIEGGAQENLVDGGLGGLAVKLAGRLGDSVKLNSPVRSISQVEDRVVVDADGTSVHARRAVVTVPPALALDIRFDPPLPEDRRSLYAAAVGGHETKTLVVYDEPFWRGDGFSGQSAEPGSAAEVTIDASPSDASCGVLACFRFGRNSEQALSLPEADRSRAVVDALTARFGSRASTPSTVVETAWWEQRWSRGCSTAHLPPGYLTRYGHLLREPFGLIHWAGTETATLSHGAVDGAIRSGERAASEILAGL
jgi:monoamine oxidase